LVGRGFDITYKSSFMKGRQNGGYAKIIEYNFLTDSIDIDIIKKKQMPFLIPM